MKIKSALICSDLHIGSDLMAKLRGFDDAQHYFNKLKQAWNSANRDSHRTVIIAGDVCRSQSDVAKLDELTGNKHIIAGNHDHGIDFGLLPAYAMLESKVLQCIITHLPVHQSYFCYGKAGWSNVHGHTHGIVLGKPYINVCFEQIGLAPLPLADVMAMSQPICQAD